jgi:hypothetical protein
MISCDHAIAGASIGGLRETLFSPRNSLQASTRPFSKTVVSIAAHSRKIKTQACYGPAMRWGRQSHDLDGAPQYKIDVSTRR